MKVRAILFLLIMCGAVSAPATGAADLTEVGRVVALRGSVTAEAPENPPRDLAVKSKIYRQDTIATGPRGRLQIMFKDNTIVSLGPRGTIEIAEYGWDAEKRSGKMETRIHEGAFRIMGGSLTRSAPENFTTETPNATIGIRGSMFAGKVAEGELMVLFQGGQGIFVTNAAGTVDIDRPGFGTRVGSPDDPPEEPRAFTPEEIEELDAGLQTPASRDDATEADETEPTGETTTEEDGELSSFDETTDDTTTTEAIDTTSTTDETGETTTDLATDTTTDVTETELETNLDANTEVEAVAMSGRYLGILSDDDPALTPADALWPATVAAETQAESLSGSATASDGKVIPFEYTVPVYDTSLTYSSVTRTTGLNHTVNLSGADRAFTSMETLTTNTGEFSIFDIREGVFSEGSTTYLFQEVGFAGVASDTLPAGGVDRYSGPFTGVYQSADSSDFSSEFNNFDLAVNWGNRTVLGAIFESPDTTSDPLAQDDVLMFVYGKVDGTGLRSLRFIGFDQPGDTTDTTTFDPTVIGGAGTFGQFYGQGAQGLGFTGEGSDFDIRTQTDMGDWNLIAAGFRDLSSPAETPGTGQHTWQGFAVGIGEDMSNPDVGRRLFMNDSPDQFQLLVDKDLGTFSGSLSASDRNDSTLAISGMEVGGTHGSAYVTDKIVIAEMGGTPITDGNLSSALKPHGNFMVIEDPEQSMTTYATWGYWEIAYQDPGTGADYHVHAPGSLWITGERTAASEVQALIDQGFVGSYQGFAAGSRIDANGLLSELTDGTSDVTVDFSSTAAQPVSGQLLFNEATLDFSGLEGSVTTDGFSAIVDGALQSDVKGAFYGPSAATLGGRFDAAMSTGERYLGIFGADLQ